MLPWPIRPRIWYAPARDFRADPRIAAGSQDRALERLEVEPTSRCEHPLLHSNRNESAKKARRNREDRVRLYFESKGCAVDARSDDRRAIGKCVPSGQNDPEAASLACFARDVDASAVAGDDAVADAQAQAHSMTRRLGREEWIERLRHEVGRHAAAIVAYLDRDLVTRRKGRDDDPPVDSTGDFNGSRGIGEEVEDDLVDVGGGPLHSSGLAEVAIDGDPQSADRLVEHEQALVDRFVNVKLAD